MNTTEIIARATDPVTWLNWDNWIGLKGYTEAEAAEEFARSPSLIASLGRAECALEALAAAGYVVAAAEAEKVVHRPGYGGYIAGSDGRDHPY